MSAGPQRTGVLGGVEIRRPQNSIPFLSPPLPPGPCVLPCCLPLPLTVLLHVKGGLELLLASRLVAGFDGPGPQAESHGVKRGGHSVASHAPPPAPRRAPDKLREVEGVGVVSVPGHQALAGDRDALWVLRGQGPGRARCSGRDLKPSAHNSALVPERHLRPHRGRLP